MEHKTHVTEVLSLPRVLVITPQVFSSTVGYGVTLNNLFSGWPKDKLACIHDDSLPTAKDTCEHYYRLSHNEVRKWGFFNIVNRIRRNDTNLLPVTEHLQRQADNIFNFCALGKRLAKMAISIIYGADEIPEYPVVTPKLDAWIRDFKPDILFCTLGHNGMMRLQSMIAAHYHIPYVVHISDNWRATKYTTGLVAFFRRRAMHKYFRRSISSASRRFGICDFMCAAYEAEFKVPFEPFYNAIDLSAWQDIAKNTLISPGPKRIVYSGSILPFAQQESLVDICRAVAWIRREGGDICLEIYTSAYLIDRLKPQMEIDPAITLHPLIADRDDYCKSLCAASLLLLPVNFDQNSISFIRYSMPGKLAEYLASQTPVLVYGPKGVAQVEDALQKGWAKVITQRNANHLLDAIEQLIAGKKTCDNLVQTGNSVVKAEYDIAVLREKFRSTISDSVYGDK